MQRLASKVLTLRKDNVILGARRERGEKGVLCLAALHIQADSKAVGMQAMRLDVSLCLLRRIRA